MMIKIVQEHWLLFVLNSMLSDLLQLRPIRASSNLPWNKIIELPNKPKGYTHGNDYNAICVNMKLWSIQIDERQIDEHPDPMAWQ